jgi:pimeloyl-ACP methyl ester carboxylesterase
VISNRTLTKTTEIEAHRLSVDTATGPVSYIDVGSAFFLHGVGTNALLWRRVIEALAPERRCVAIDLPLHGRTPAAANQDFSLRGLAEVVEAFCEATQLKSVDLVAHDTGGAVAQIFAAQQTHRLRSLCLTNCDTHDNVPPEAFKPTIELAASGALAAGAPALLADLEAARDLVFGSGYEDVTHLDLDVVRSFLEPVLGTPERAAQFERLLLSLGPDDLLGVEPQLAVLGVPTLIVWAAADVFFDLSWAYWLKDLIPGATEVIEIEQARLFFPDERSTDLVDALRTHWATTASLGRR